MFFSIIIPVYNRPEEVQDLLTTIASQTFVDFEVLVIEDGSTLTAEEVCNQFNPRFVLRYFYQKNSGQGFARNFGMNHAKGEFFVILDSDVLLPEKYLEILFNQIQLRKLDAFGGPDRSDESFSTLQKAMDFAMTSFWTTGGIRGKLKDPSKFQARGFNMGVSKKVFEKIGGFVDPNRGEDIEWSIRIKKSGFKLELIEEAFVYHKRRNTLKSFANQAFSFGQNRVNVSRFHPDAIKVVHLLPSAFLIFLISCPFMAIINSQVFITQLILIAGWAGAILLSSLIKYNSLQVSLLSLLTSLIQLCSYGTGLVFEWVKKKVVA